MNPNHWLRLWHDMPNDPKWKTIAKVSGQPISLVIATYVHMLVDASRNVTRGHTDVTAEDISSALDVEKSDIEAIFDAMQNRVVVNGFLSGWDERQPKKEPTINPETGVNTDTERQRRYREQKKLAQQMALIEQFDDEENVCHALSRDVTTEKRREEVNNNTVDFDSSTKPKSDYDSDFLTFFAAYPSKGNKQQAFKAWKKKKPSLNECLSAIDAQKKWREECVRAQIFAPNWKLAATWLNNACWEDDVSVQSVKTSEMPEKMRQFYDSNGKFIG